MCQKRAVSQASFKDFIHWTFKRFLFFVFFEHPDHLPVKKHFCLDCPSVLSWPDLLFVSPLCVADLSESGAKRQYDRDFLLGFQFMPACTQKPEGLPPISDVVLDKVNETRADTRLH